MPGTGSTKKSKAEDALAKPPIDPGASANREHLIRAPLARAIRARKARR